MIPAEVLKKLNKLRLQEAIYDAVLDCLKDVEEATAEERAAPLKKRRQNDVDRQARRRRSRRGDGNSGAASASRDVTQPHVTSATSAENTDGHVTAADCHVTSAASP